MKTLITASAVALSGLLAVSAPVFAAPAFIAGAPYNQNIDGAAGQKALANQPTPNDVMIPGSSQSRRLYDAQIRDTVSASTGEGYRSADHQQSRSRLLMPGSSVDF